MTARVIGTVIDIPALIAWAERAARRHRSVKPASRQRRWPEGPGFTDRWRGADNRTCDGQLGASLRRFAVKRDLFAIYDAIGIGERGGRKLAGLRGVMSKGTVEDTCRMFLCARCRSQVFVCARCDRGNVYCPGTCAQEGRRARQREARRRYQATDRGRAMHAARNRRYRARSRCVTDQGPNNNHKAGTLLASDVHVALSKPPVGAKWLSQPICHHCRRSTSLFVRRSPLRPRRDARRKGSLRSGLL